MKKLATYTTLLRTGLSTCSKAMLCVANAIALFVCVGCQQEIVAPAATTTTTLTIGLDDTPATRTSAWTNPTLTNMTVTVLLCEGNQVVAKQTKAGCDLSDSKQVTIDIEVVTGKTYNIAVWADFNKGYYTLADVGEEPIMTLVDNTEKGTKNDADGYFGHEQHTFTYNESVPVSLTRPFALIAVNTNNWNTATQPSTYAMTYTAPTQLNLTTGEVAATATCTLTGAISTAAAEDDVKELSFDYILATATASTLPNFTINYYPEGSATASSAYTFTNIQAQRNYKTNITGKILSEDTH